MSDVERAKALLQAAGVSGVSVQEADETVTVPRAELNALRAAQAAPGLTPGQEYAKAQEEQAAAQQAAALPPGILSAEQTEAELNRIEGLPAHQRNDAMSDALLASWEHHKREGR